ncbi:DUF6541 family protein [Microbacterium sp. NPDC089189]|uniref:DUF6541 family protein n=1 Tax=Microbacterium sp. NPDC089189 TaxID=3154972 RepID=UPI003432BDF5
MTWLDLVGAVGALLALTFVVGGGVAWAVGLRGLWLAAAAPAFFATIAAGAAVVAPWVGLPWSILPVVLVGAVIAGGSILARRLLPRRPHPAPPRARSRWQPWLILAIALPVVILTWRAVTIMGSPDAFSQTFDNIFHLNGVRFVLDEANASSLHLGYMTSPSGSLAFYPAAWHGVVALIVQVSGVTIPVATNAMILGVSAIFWPLGSILLARTLGGSSPALLIAAGALSASIPAFPVLLYDYGVLYPLLFGVSLLPFALAVAVHVLGIARDVPPVGWGWWILILAGAVVGMTLAHPGAFVALLALSFPAVCVAGVSVFRRSGVGGRIGVLVGFLAYLGAGVLLVKVLRPPLDARGWPITQSMGDAVISALTGSMWYQVPAFGAAVLIVAGIVWTLIDRSRAAWVLLGMYVIGAWLYVVVVSLPFGNLRDAFTGSWYNNAPRLAAIFVVAMVPIGAYGAARTFAWVAGLVRRRSGGVARPALRATLGVLGAVALVAVLQVGAMPRAVEWASPLYRITDTAPLVSTDEYALLGRLDDDVPADAVVAGDPFAGAAMAYALADRRVLLPHALVEMDDARARLVDALRTGRLDAEACAAAEDEEVRYVLDFGTAGVHGPIEGYPGLAESTQVTLIDSEGDARLYALTGCSLPE